MKLRRLIRLYMICSAALAVLLGAMWARSGVRGDYWTWGRGETMYCLRSDWGYLAFARIRSTDLPQGFHWQINHGGYSGATYGPETRRFYTDVLAIRSGKFDALSDWRDSAFYQTGTYFHLSMSYALPIALLLLPPMIWMSLGLYRRRKVQRRQMLGQCIVCGYDLRASSGACPECGAPVSMQNVLPSP
jgi:hypothetical protein